MALIIVDTAKTVMFSDKNTNKIVFYNIELGRHITGSRVALENLQSSRSSGGRSRNSVVKVSSPLIVSARGNKEKCRDHQIIRYII